MGNSDLEQHRVDVVSKLSGIGLEIGFGSGLNLPYYKNIIKLYALDPSEELREMAQKNILAASFPVERIADSAEHIPLPDNSLDFIVSTWTLCSIPNPKMALEEVARVLKPGGKFAFAEHGKSPKTYTSIVQGLLTPVSRYLAGGCHLNRDIENIILDTGFEIQRLEKFSQKSKPLGFMYKGIAIPKK